MPAFLWYSTQSIAQIRAAEGFVDGTLLAEQGKVFWTLTRWKNEESLRAWRGSGAHAKAMPKLAAWCDEARLARWESPDAALPGWEDCQRRMREEGRVTRVRYPSQDHGSETFPAFDPGRMRREYPLRPARAH